MSETADEQILENGFRLHQAGKLAEAEAEYRRVLEFRPRHPRALHLLGVLAFQLGQNIEALKLLEESVAAESDSAEIYGHLGLVLASCGRIAEAITAYHRALKVRADLPEVQNNLGNAFRQAGQVDEAMDAYRRAIALKPEFVEAHNNLGLALVEQRQFEPAIEAFQKAHSLRPADAKIRNHLASALNNAGVTRFGRGDAAGAIAFYCRALETTPDYADARYNLSIALTKTGDTRQAIEQCRRATELRPDFAEAHNNLGILLQGVGDLSGAIAAFSRAVQARPDYAEAHSNLGNVLRLSGKMSTAIDSYRRAIVLRADSPETHNNLGSALQQSGRLAEAVSSFQRALELRPDLAEAHNNLGNAFKDQGELDQALACYERAAALAGDDPAAASNRLYTLHFHPDYSAHKLLEEHLKWNKRYTAPLARAIRPHDNDSNPGRRLRIGYVSPYFRDHCQALFLVPLLWKHDRQSFEVFCYSDVVAPDAMTDRLKDHADVWRSIVGMSDQHLAELIRQDKIDILVDLSVHMANNCLLAFARKPAPVQVTWLGYPGTTGLETMDYRLSDPFLDPVSHDRHYSEQTLRLPDSFWCYDPLTDGPEVNELPVLHNGYITFGCLNNFCKVTEKTLKLWSQVMIAVADSRLVVLAPRGEARERLLEKLDSQGISPTRIEFADRAPRAEYLKLYHRIDIGLDTFPYNGHTTTLDSLWMGVPVVTIAGRTAVSRAGWSQLSNLGSKELAGKSEKQFVRIASDLAADLPRLTAFRLSLRNKLSQSPLMDARRFARNIEDAYRQMWRQWSSQRDRPLAQSA